ncbi:MAG TPA: hypothetical protein VFT53_07465 [Candidatus Saccharimonadales bacterium]|nr:hypothetical protein [Candidatus Saccharimonadales bacterium]
MAKDKNPEKPTNIKKIHKDDKSLTRASDKTQKPKGKVEKALREWVEDIDSTEW